MLIRVDCPGAEVTAWGQQAFPSNSQAPAQSCVSPLGLGPAQVPEKSPCPLPPWTGYISLAASLLSSLQTSFDPSLTPLTA